MNGCVGVLHGVGEWQSFGKVVRVWLRERQRVFSQRSEVYKPREEGKGMRVADGNRVMEETESDVAPFRVCTPLSAIGKKHKNNSKLRQGTHGHVHIIPLRPVRALLHKGIVLSTGNSTHCSNFTIRLPN